MNRGTLYGTASILAALSLTVATAGSNTDTVAVTATKPGTTVQVSIRSTADNADFNSIDFGALTMDTPVDSSAFIIKVNTHNVATGGQPLDLTFSWPGQTGYTLQYKVDAGAATDFSTSLTKTAAQGQLLNHYYATAGLTSDLTAASTVKLTVTADGTADADLNSTVTLTATLP